MSDTPTTGDIVSSHPKATLLTSFTAVLEGLSQQIKDDDLKKIAIPLAPFLALLLMMIIKHMFKKYECKNLIKIREGWIKELELEKQNPDTSPDRKKEIVKEIAGLKKEVQKLQISAIEIKFT